MLRGFRWRQRAKCSVKGELWRGFTIALLSRKILRAPANYSGDSGIGLFVVHEIIFATKFAINSSSHVGGTRTAYQPASAAEQRVIVFVQAGETGPVLGAAECK